MCESDSHIFSKKCQTHKKNSAAFTDQTQKQIAKFSDDALFFYPDKYLTLLTAPMRHTG